MDIFTGSTSRVILGSGTGVVSSSPVPTLAFYDNQPLKLVSEGQTISESVAAGGSGYAALDTGKMLGNSSDQPNYVIDSVDGGGAVLTFHLVSQSSSDTAGGPQNTSVTTGAGDGNFTINVDSVVEPLVGGNGTLRVTVLYSVITL